jgi:hypothetical protein
MDATLPSLVRQLADINPSPWQSEIRALLKKSLAAGQWSNRGMHDVQDELQAVKADLQAIADRLERIEALLAELRTVGKDVPE